METGRRRSRPLLLLLLRLVHILLLLGRLANFTLMFLHAGGIFVNGDDVGVQRVRRRLTSRAATLAHAAHAAHDAVRHLINYWSICGSFLVIRQSNVTIN